MLFDGSSYYWEKWAYCKLLRAFGAALVSSLMWRAVRTTAFTPNSASSTAVVSSGVLRLHETRQVSSARCNRWPESDRLVHLTLCSSRAMKLYRHASSSSTPARAMSQLWEMKLHHCDNSYKRAVHNHYQGLRITIAYDSTPHGLQHRQTWTTMPTINGQAVLTSRVAGTSKKEAEENAARQVWDTVINA